MYKNLIFILIFLPFYLQSQTQIGVDIDGKLAGDQLGWSTAISNDGSIIAVGASGIDDRKGYVQVYKNESGTLTQLGDDIIGDNKEDFFGQSVALSDDGNIIAIGAHFNSDNSDNLKTGIVKVYKLENNIWIQMGNTISGTDIERNQTGTYQEDTEFGYSISLSANGLLIAIGAPKADYTCHSCTFINNCGQVLIYEFDNNDWEGRATIYGEAEEDNSGNSVSLNSDGTILAIGAANNDGNGNNSGHARIYKLENNSWSIYGDDINGEGAYDLSGFSVSLSKNGNRVAIGATTNDGNDGNDTDSGHVRLYEDGVSSINKWFTSWSDYDGEASVDQFGYSVSLSSDGYVMAVGSIDNDGNGSKSGHVRVFTNYEQSKKIGIDIDGEASGDQSGFSVSISGDGTKVVIGAPFNDGNGGNSGHARVYDLSAILSSDSFVLSKFSIYPNPANNLFTIQLKDNLEVQKISIYNSLGQFIKSSKELSINTSNLSKGVYFLEVVTNFGKASKKLIIE